MRCKEGGSVNESSIMDAIRLELGDVTRYPDVWLTRNNCGALQDANGQYVRYGLGPGSGDLVGMFTTSDGRALWIEAEIKTQTGKQSDEQVRRQTLVEKRGGVYVVLRSVDDAREWIQQLRSGSASRRSA